MARRDATNWTTAYRLLPGARAASAKCVKDALTFAEEAFELSIALQVSWKATPEAVLEQLELRFAPQFYLDHAFTKNSLSVWLETDTGKQRCRVPRRGEDPNALVGVVAKLVGLQALALVPLNDGDDLHYLVVTEQVAEKLEALLGGAFGGALARV